MKAAISGMNGFIGSHLAVALQMRGVEVVQVTRELLYSPAELRKFFNTQKPDYIFHLAAYGNMSNQKEIPMTIFSNIIGTFNMLHESKDISYKAFVNFGSSSEYGVKSQPMSEKDKLEPQTFYGASKAGATHLAFAFRQQFKKPIITVRPFSVYGPGEADFRFIPTVIRSMLFNQPFMLDKDANHDWIFISDFIEGLLIATDKVNAITNGEINIGTGRSHTNEEICLMLKKISGIKYLANPVQYQRPYDSEVWISDNTFISQLGFFPKHMLQEGLIKTWDFYKEKYEKTN